MIRYLQAAFAAICLISAPALFAEMLDINRASAEEIATALKGVGIQRARAIVAWRKAHGPFTRIEQLTEVKGIGPATVEKNRQRIRLGEDSAQAGTQGPGAVSP